jgi:hypothetical protein
MSSRSTLSYLIRMLRDIGLSGFTVAGLLSLAIFSRLVNYNAFISLCLND